MSNVKRITHVIYSVLKVWLLAASGVTALLSTVLILVPVDNYLTSTSMPYESRQFISVLFTMVGVAWWVVLWMKAGKVFWNSDEEERAWIAASTFPIVAYHLQHQYGWSFLVTVIIFYCLWFTTLTSVAIINKLKKRQQEERTGV